MTDTTLKHYMRGIIILILCTALAACGGGIFGTGTGDADNTAIDIDGPAAQVPATTEPSPEQPDTGDTGITPDEITEGATPEPAPTDPTPPASVPPASEPAGSEDHTLTTQPFINMSPSGQDGLPLLKIINVSTTSLNARNESSDSTLFSAPIIASSSSESLELPLGESTLTLIEAESTNALVSFNPLNAAMNTVTTLLARTPLATDGSSNSVIDVLALPTRVTPTAPDMVLLRIVQASALGTDSQTASFTLVPQGPNPGMGEVVYPEMNAQTNAASQYQLLTPGDYVLSDSLGRFVNQSLSLQTDTVYTVILTDTVDEVIYLEVDGEP